VDLAAQHAQADTQRERDACAAERQQANAWLDRHADRLELADQWQRWDTLLTQARQAHADSTALHGNLATALELSATRRGAFEVAAHARLDADTRAMAAQRALDNAEPVPGRGP
jgi:hypothetical protein